MKPIMFSLVLSLSCALFLSDAEAQQQQSQPENLSRLLAQLQSDDFQLRLKTARQLATLPMPSLKALADLPAEQLSAEAAAQLLNALEIRYSSDEITDDTKAASQILENFLTSKRLMLADGAEKILRKHWRRRVQLVRQHMEALGARFRDGDFTSIENLRWMPGGEMPSLQLFLGEEWKGTTEDLKQLERMSVLTDSRLRLTGLSVWVLVGHSLSPADFAVLHEVVGQTRVYERSRVALGIRSTRSGGPGVLIEAVTRGGSAQAAGLQPYDYLVSIEEPIPEDASAEQRAQLLEAQRLRDFDDLVERLKKYRPGDEVKFRVIRGMVAQDRFGQRIVPGLRGPEQTITVKLKGWHEIPAEP